MTGGPRGRRRRRGRDRGDTSVEIVLFAPLMFLVVLVLFQAGAVFWADLSARHAAQQGLQTARVHGATGPDGQAAAAALLEEINPQGLSDVDITVVREADTTTVTVTGTALSIIPVIPIQITAQASGPTEPAGSSG